MKATAIAALIGALLAAHSGMASAGGSIDVTLPGVTGSAGTLSWDQIGENVRILSASNTSSTTVRDLHLTFQAGTEPSFTRGIVLNPSLGPGESFNGITNPPPLWFTNIGFATVNVTRAEWSVTGAVPEPEAYALFLAGLGIVGLIGRRNRRIVKS